MAMQANSTKKKGHPPRLNKVGGLIFTTKSKKLLTPESIEEIRHSKKIAPNNYANNEEDA